LEKKELMPLIYSEEDMAAMLLVREAFAPENRLNPGKIFPDGISYLPPARRPEPGLSI